MDTIGKALGGLDGIISQLIQKRILGGGDAAGDDASTPGAEPKLTGGLAGVTDENSDGQQEPDGDEGMTPDLKAKLMELLSK